MAVPNISFVKSYDELKGYSTYKYGRRCKLNKLEEALPADRHLLVRFWLEKWGEILGLLNGDNINCEVIIIIMGGFEYVI